MPSLPTFDALTAFLHTTLDANAYPSDEQGGAYRLPAPTAHHRPIARLGLALEPWPGLREWAADTLLDALFLHRPWRLPPGVPAPEIGVLYSHLPFDEHLTTGLNVPLATQLGFRTREALGHKHGRPLGMLGEIAPVRAADAMARVAELFGGAEEVILPFPARLVDRVAVVGAMNEALVREAATRGAGVYVTGQLRAPARAAVAETGIAVSAIGHARSERWGLHALATLVAARWPALTTLVNDGHRALDTTPGFARE